MRRRFIQEVERNSEELQTSDAELERIIAERVFR